MIHRHRDEGTWRQTEAERGVTLPQPRQARDHQELSSPRSWVRSLRRRGPANTVTADCWASRTMPAQPLLFQATRSVLICYRSPRRHTRPLTVTVSQRGPRFLWQHLPSNGLRRSEAVCERCVRRYVSDVCQIPPTPQAEKVSRFWLSFSIPVSRMHPSGATPLSLSPPCRSLFLTKRAGLASEASASKCTTLFSYLFIKNSIGSPLQTVL